MYVQDGTFRGWEQSGFWSLLGGTEVRTLYVREKSGQHLQGTFVNYILNL